jgi:hypothetical protein
MWRSGGPWVVLSVGWALACGGRYERSAPNSDAVGLAGSSASSSSSRVSGSGSGGFVGGGGRSAAAGSAGVIEVAGSAGLMDIACANQFIDYVDYRSQVMTEFSSYGCMIDSDCRNFYDQSACDPSCVPLLSSAHRGIIDRLNTFELLNCDLACSPQPWVACPLAPPAHCVSGSCQ